MAVAGSRVAASRAHVLLVVVGGAAAAHAERVRLVATLTERAGTLADLTLQFASISRWGAQVSTAEDRPLIQQPDSFAVQNSRVRNNSASSCRILCRQSSAHHGGRPARERGRAGAQGSLRLAWVHALPTRWALPPPAVASTLHTHAVSRSRSVDCPAAGWTLWRAMRSWTTCSMVSLFLYSDSSWLDSLQLLPLRTLPVASEIISARNNSYGPSRATIRNEVAALAFRQEEARREMFNFLMSVSQFTSCRRP